MKIVRRHGPEDLGSRIEAGHQRARDAALQVPLLSIEGWEGVVLLGAFGFDGRTAGVAHLTADYRPARSGAPVTGGRIDTVTRLLEDGPSVMFPWDDHARVPTAAPQPTGHLAVTIVEERCSADTWYRRGDWVCRIGHGRFVTTITARAIPLEPLRLLARDDLEPLLVARRKVLQRWATSPQ